MTQEELSAYGASSGKDSLNKKNSAFWSKAAMHILTDRQPQEAFLADDDDLL